MPADRYRVGQQEQEFAPAGREFGVTNDVDAPEQGRGMGEALGCTRDEIAGPQHRLGKTADNGIFQRGDGGEARVLARTSGEIHTSAPRLVQRVSRGTDKAGQVFDTVELAQIAVGQRCLDRITQRLRINAGDEPTRQSSRKLLQCHDLDTVPLGTRGIQPDLTSSQPAMGDERLALH